MIYALCVYMCESKRLSIVIIV